MDINNKTNNNPNSLPPYSSETPPTSTSTSTSTSEPSLESRMPSSVPLATSQLTKKEQTYLFANQCDLEIYCSPFGVSALYVNIKNSGIVGIGSTMGRITGQTKGRVYYNNGEDFKKKKFKIHGIVDDDNMLRIDFFRIFKNEGKVDPLTNELINKEGAGASAGNSSHSSPAATTGASPADSSKLSKDDEDGDNDGVEVPDIIFKGVCPSCRPEKVDPFIGVFSFETED